MQKQLNHDEINLAKLYRTLVNYKWLILLLTLLTFFLTFFTLYFKPSIYSSSAILEVKSKSNKMAPNDLLLSALSMGNVGGQIDKEIEMLQTFSVNKEALKKVNFKVQFYKKKNYKNIELYNNIPLKVSNIKIFNREIIGKTLILYPNKETFQLELKSSFGFSSSTLVGFNNQNFIYNKEIKTNDIQFTLTKNTKIKEPIYFVVYGDNRTVFDDIITTNLRVQQLNASASLIKISYEDNIPQRANDYVNALAKSFIERNTITKNEQNNKIITFIDKQLISIKKTLKASEDELESYKVSNHIIQPSIEATSYITKLANLEISIAENTLREKLILNLIKFEKHSQSLDSVAPTLMELQDKPTLQLITSLQNLQLKEKSLKIELTDQHPKIISLHQQISTVRQKIHFNIRNLKNNNLQRKQSLYAEKKVYEKKIKTLPTKEKKLVNIKRDYKVSSTLYNYLLKKKTENEILMIATLSDYKIIDSAHTTGIPIKPKRLLILVASLFVGLLLGVVIAVLLEGMNHKIYSKEDLESLTNLPLYGIVPLVKHKDLRLEVYANPNSHFTESLRSLRSNIQVKKRGSGANIILLTSTVAGEGKSTLTANLGAVFQMAGHKTLLINLDLRKPTLHNYFNIQNSKGMSGFLSNRNTVHDIIFSTEYKNLHLIPSGIIPSNPSELILSNRFEKLLDILKTRYDYIFIDSAPVGLVSDSIHLMKYTDLNLIVFRENYAEKSFVSSLDNLIDKHHLQNIGMILNASDSKQSHSYGYGYGYGYGDK